MKKSMIITLVAMFFSMVSFAQPNNDAQPEGREMPTVEQIAKYRAERLKQQLLLSQEQYDKVYQICLAQAEKDVARMQQIKAEREKSNAEMKGILNETQYERYEKMQQAPRHGQFGGHNHRKGAPARQQPMCDDKRCDDGKACQKCEKGEKCEKCERPCDKCEKCDKKEEGAPKFKSPNAVKVQRGERMQQPADRRRNQNAYNYTDEAKEK